MTSKARIIALALLLAVLGRPALAEYPVVDMTAIKKLGEQLNKAVEQIKILTDMRDQLQAQIDAIGRMGQITLPMINGAKMVSRLRQDMQCLKPDFSKLMPHVNFEDIELNSICQASSAYQQSLFVNKGDLIKLPTWTERESVLKAIEERRRRVLEDAATKGLAQGDMAAQDGETLTKAIDDVEASARGATTQNARLAAIIQGQVVQARAMAQQNQILAQLLKVQSAFAIQAGVTIQSDLVEASENGNGGGQ